MPDGLDITSYLLGMTGGAKKAAQAALPHRGTITLSTTWSGSGPYTQTVTVTGAAVTSKSAVSLCPTAAQLAQWIDDGVTGLIIDNNAGTLTVTALGAATTVAMTLACLVQETVEAAT